MLIILKVNQNCLSPLPPSSTEGEYLKDNSRNVKPIKVTHWERSADDVSSLLVCFCSLLKNEWMNAELEDDYSLIIDDFFF